MQARNSNGIQGVLAANDGLAGAVIASLQAHGLKPIPLTGQDATPTGVQYILAGWQTGTVYKSIRLEANAAAKLAVNLIKGKTPKTTAKVSGTPSVLLTPVWLTKHNYKKVFTDGFLKKIGRLHRQLRAVLQVGITAGRGGSTAPPGVSMLTPVATTTPTLELRGISKSLRLRARPHGCRLRGARRRGHGARRRQRRRQVDPHQVHRRHQPDRLGRVLLRRQAGHINGPRDAAKLGIEIVYQDLALCDNLDVVAEHVPRPGDPRRPTRLKDAPMEQRAAETLKSLSVTTIGSIRQPVSSLSGGQRQSIAVARAVLWNSRSSSSTSRPRRSASRRRARCSTSSSASAPRVSPS